MSSQARQPWISRYVGPPMLPGPAIFVLFVASQIYIHLASSSYALTAREAIGKALGRGFMKGLGKLILGIHVLESAYILTRCVKYQCTPLVTIKYLVGTMVLGFGQMKVFNEQVRIAERRK